MGIIGAATPLYPPHSRVGAWLTTHEHLRHLAARGHDVHVTTTMAARPDEIYEGVHIHGRHRPPRGDVIIAHVGDLGFGRAAARRDGVPLILFAHGQVKNPRHLDGASLVVFVSQALAAATDWDGPSLVVSPPLDPAGYQTTRGDAVTLVNLSLDKGGDLFWALAAAEPRRAFVAVRGGHGRQTRQPGRPNVDLVRYPVADMRTVYCRTRVLLMPSVTETWGRVALEAAASGIPTIAHPSPGLIEALGDSGMFVDRTDLAGWRQALARLDDPYIYAAASARAFARAAELDPARSLALVADAVEAFAPMEATA